jgi:thymidylate synthase ThyX
MTEIFIYDEFNPEDIAMMQALYSRSGQSVLEHVKKVQETGSGKFMEKFYVGYGHQSIADCGSTTIFIENLSILADKAIQDWPLYSGQETSTRYIDMSKRDIIDPANTPESKAILDNWMNFYTNKQEELKEYIKNKYPKKEEEKQEIYEKTVAAKAFDVMRGFLPAGITTQLSWHTNLRQAWDKLAWLQHHPLAEIRNIAKQIITSLQTKYPHSFCHPIYEDQEKYRQETAAKYNYYDPSGKIEGFSFKTTIKNSELEQYEDLISTRPPKIGLPIFLAELGQIQFDFMLDFGSFRDIQRHRNGVCRMPLLTAKHGFNNWYLEQLPESIRTEAEELIANQIKTINGLNINDLEKQYYLAVGFNIPCRTTYALPAAVYVAELRSGKPVHPSLRQVAHQMCQSIQNEFPKLKLHCDLEPSDWDIKRGEQDIIKK